MILGSLAPQKGRALLETIWPSVMDRVELYLIGGCDEDGAIFDGKPGITVMQRYNHAELANIMADIQPELGVLLSIWPETFSYTLSELWLFGIPVLATAMGSFADRIEGGPTAFSVHPRRKRSPTSCAGSPPIGTTCTRHAPGWPISIIAALMTWWRTTTP